MRKGFKSFLGNSGILDKEHSTVAAPAAVSVVVPVAEESIYAARKRMRMEL